VFLMLAVPFLPGRARACELRIPQLRTIDPAQVGVDQTPPQLAQPTVAELHKNDIGGGALGCQPKCGFDHSARITNLATDDMTPVDQIGYRVALVSGDVSFVSTGRSDGAVLAATDGLSVFWDGDDDFDFTIQMVAIDAAGNESAPRNVQISSGGGGCSIGHGRLGDGVAVVVVALAVAIARARTRRPTPSHVLR
jgi:hypothetical protein